MVGQITDIFSALTELAVSQGYYLVTIVFDAAIT
jgi:hypothetical protein